MSADKRPRLVIDNSSLASSSTSLSLAKKSKGKCQRGGIAPRFNQSRIAFGDSVPGNAPAKASQPPKRETISLIPVSIRTDCVTDGRRGQAQLVLIRQPSLFLPDDGNRFTGQALCMEAGIKSEKAYKKRVLDRLESLIEAMGWDEKTFVVNAARELKVSEKAVSRYFERRSVPHYNLTRIAIMLGVSMNYMSLVTDDVSKMVDPYGLFARESKRDLQFRNAIKDAKAGKYSA